MIHIFIVDLLFFNFRANKRNPAPVQGYGNAGSSYPNSPPHQSQAPPAYGGRYDTQQSYPGYREPQPQEPYSGTQGHYRYVGW